MQQKDANATEQANADDDTAQVEYQEPKWWVSLKRRTNQVLDSRIFWACYAVLFFSLLVGCAYLVAQVP